MKFSSILSFLFIFFTIFNHSIFSQPNENRLLLKEYSFGKCWFVGDNNPEDFWDSEKREVGFVNSEGRFFSIDKALDQGKFRRILQAKELKIIRILGSQVEDNPVNMAQLKGEINAYISLENIKIGSFGIDSLILRKDFKVMNLESKGVISFQKIQSFANFDFYQCKFYPYVWDSLYNFFNTEFELKGSIFTEESKFELCYFYQNAYFYNLYFRQSFSFYHSKFFGSTIFGPLISEKSFNLAKVEFLGNTEFQYCDFRNELNLFMTKFDQEIDFRKCNFDSLKTIVLERTDYQIGKLYVDWDQLKMKDHPIINCNDLEASDIDKFNRLKIIYEKLIANYLAQGNKSSADDVSYELQYRKDLLLDDDLQSLYGVIMGYGYKPWKYLLFLVAPIILIFSVIYYLISYEVIFYVMTKNVAKLDHSVQKSKNKIQLPVYKMSSTGLSYKKIPILIQIWHSLYVSTSILVGLRFKKEWIRLENNKFLVIASIQWLLGITMYILFVLLIKSFRFDFLKGIFGF